MGPCVNSRAGASGLSCTPPSHVCSPLTGINRDLQLKSTNKTSWALVNPEKVLRMWRRAASEVTSRCGATTWRAVRPSRGAQRRPAWRAAWTTQVTCYSSDSAVADRVLPSQRHMFDLPRDVAYLNAAYMSPMLHAQHDAVYTATRRKQAPWEVSDQRASAALTRPDSGNR